MTDKETDILLEEAESMKTSRWYSRSDSVIMVLLLLFSIVGIGITDISPKSCHWYWLLMVVATGIACISMEWSRARKNGQSAAKIIKEELLIWFSVLVAVQLVYFLFESGRLNSENTGLVILLILAMSTFQAGLRLGWRLFVLGGLLGGTLFLATYLEVFLWIVLIVVLAAAAAVYFMARKKSVS